MAQGKIGVVGAGNMGAGIAQKYATEGFTVVVVDLDPVGAKRGEERVRATLDEGVKRKIFAPEKRDEILGRMSFTADRDALKGADLVVEAIFEDKQVKQDLFADLDQRLDKSTILATNTSSFYVEDLASVCQHKDRVLGLHYFYHPAKNRLVEVIAGKSTARAAFERAWLIQEQSGKTPIESADAPGFIVNRYFVPWLNESMRIVAEGLANIATVEAAAKKAFGVGMGPFELMNVTGVPITLHAATTLGAELGPFYVPCDLIRPIVDRKANWELTGEVDVSRFAAIGERLWGVVFQIATTLVFDEKVCTVEDCDLGARVGLRWPKGPFEVMNAWGMRRAHDAVASVVKHHAATSAGRFSVPASLALAAESNQPIAIRLVSHRVESGVGYVTFQRPDAMNALNPEVMQQLANAFTAVEQDDTVKGIVIEGKGKAFVAGADTKWFVEQQKADDVAAIVNFADFGQKLFRRIDTCKKPVICKLHGLSLGGGSELALACDHIVATAKGSMGFPETGIGIYPGLGGTQRSARRVGVPLARWLLLTGETVDAKTGVSMGMIDACVDASELEATCRKLALSGNTRPDAMPRTNPPAGFEPVWNALQFTSVVDLLAGKANVTDAQLQKSLKKAAFKAPLAAKAADELAKAAATCGIDAGLKMETDGLFAIFSSADAVEGLSTLGVRRPNYRGA